MVHAVIQKWLLLNAGKSRQTSSDQFENKAGHIHNFGSYQDKDENNQRHSSNGWKSIEQIHRKDIKFQVETDDEQEFQFRFWGSKRRTRLSLGLASWVTYNRRGNLITYNRRKGFSDTITRSKVQIVWNGDRSTEGTVSSIAESAWATGISRINIKEIGCLTAFEYNLYWKCRHDWREKSIDNGTS